jgi:hypothetical protein
MVNHKNKKTSNSNENLINSCGKKSSSANEMLSSGVYLRII